MLVEKLTCSIKFELKFLIIYSNIGFNPDSVLIALHTRCKKISYYFFNTILIATPFLNVSFLDLVFLRGRKAPSLSSTVIEQFPLFPFSALL